MKKIYLALLVVVSAAVAEASNLEPSAGNTNRYTKAMSARDAKVISEARGKRAAILSKRHDLNDTQKRAEVVRQLRELEEERTAAVRRRAEAKGLAIKGVRPDGRGFRLIDFDENDLPVYEQDENVNAAISTAANEVRSSATYNSVDGSSVTIGLWEASGTPRLTHQELAGRVTIIDGSTTVGSHATHVAGTLIAAGINSTVEGMAPGAQISAFMSGKASEEMTANGASAPGTTKIYLSNHSYGVGQGFEWVGHEDYDWTFSGTFIDDGDPSNDYEPDFGRYAYRSADWDGITYNLPYYLVFVSAGNQRSDNPSESAEHTWKYGTNIYTYVEAEHPAGDRYLKNGFDNMEGAKLAKNVITVGSVSDCVNGGVRDPSKGVTRSSSSRGPVDDGRIKPDIYANGDSVKSCDDDSNTDTATKSGTSMACPNACGSAALLVDYFSQRFPGDAMRASTLKALILHTTDDRGDAGPDYKYGWGIMNTKAAADVIKAHADNQGGGALLESSVDTGITSRTHTFGWDGTSPLRVTLCWTDPAGTQKYGHENREKALVNDLNLKVIGPGGTHYPYVMPYVGDWSVGSITDDAVTGVNDVDNVEQVYLALPTAGNYTIMVDYAGSLTDGVQVFSLVVTGQTAAEIEVEENGPPVIALVDDSGTQDFGATAPSEASVVRSYTVRNTGGSPLTDLAITKSGSHTNDFSVGALSTNLLETGQTASFTVSYDPLGTGTRTAALQVANNDLNESPFDINLAAFGYTELEAWRSDYFGTTNITGNLADDADFDVDGYVNLIEFGLATSPTGTTSDPVMFAVDSTNATLSYPRNVNALVDYDFGVVWTDNLVSNSWSTVGISEMILSDDGSVQQVESSLPMGDSSNRYFRLRIQIK